VPWPLSGGTPQAGDERRVCALPACTRAQVQALAAAAAAADTRASGRLAETFRKLHHEHIYERPAAPPGVEEPPFGP
jgi:hypothetical protein